MIMKVFKDLIKELKRQKIQQKSTDWKLDLRGNEISSKILNDCKLEKTIVMNVDGILLEESIDILKCGSKYIGVKYISDVSFGEKRVTEFKNYIKFYKVKKATKYTIKNYRFKEDKIL